MCLCGDTFIFHWVLPVPRFSTHYVSRRASIKHETSPFCTSVDHSVSARTSAPLGLNFLQGQTSGTMWIFGLKLYATQTANWKNISDLSVHWNAYCKCLLISDFMPENVNKEFSNHISTLENILYYSILLSSILKHILTEPDLIEMGLNTQHFYCSSPILLQIYSFISVS